MCLNLKQFDRKSLIQKKNIIILSLLEKYFFLKKKMHFFQKNSHCSNRSIWNGRIGNFSGLFLQNFPCQKNSIHGVRKLQTRVKNLLFFSKNSLSLYMYIYIYLDIVFWQISMFLEDSVAFDCGVLGL